MFAQRILETLSHFLLLSSHRNPSHLSNRDLIAHFSDSLEEIYEYDFLEGNKISEDSNVNRDKFRDWGIKLV